MRLIDADALAKKKRRSARITAMRNTWRTVTARRWTKYIIVAWRMGAQRRGGTC